ncbi:class II myosin, partial [Spiromyces aspiralis]
SKLERNYHVFYQFMKGASNEMKSKLLIDNGPDGYAFTKQGKKTIRGVDDEAEFKLLVSALTTTGFTPDEQFNLFRIIAAILHLGNIQVQSTRLDEAMLKEHITPEKVCHVLGIQVNDFTKALLRPSIRAGRDWVTQSRSAEQVVYSIEAL